MTGTPVRAPFAIGAPPAGRAMTTVDECIVHAPLASVFRVVADVEGWPTHLRHYRWVTMRERAADGGGVVEMAAFRPFGPVGWPTWWLSVMAVDPVRHTVRFRHIGGVTTGMDVEWSLHPHAQGTHARLVHVWDGPPWPLIGALAAVTVIGPLFIHGIASRTMAGLARAAEREPPRAA